MAERFYVITGGTIVHVAPHFALSAPAYGTVGRQIAAKLNELVEDRQAGRLVYLIRTKMALGDQAPSEDERRIYGAAGLERLETNDDLNDLIDYLIAQPDTRCIVMAAAVCDWQPNGIGYDSGLGRDKFGKDQPRLSTHNGDDPVLYLEPTEKLIGRIRKQRKDIFLVGFKATTGKSPEDCYAAGLSLLKRNSANLVVANDLHEKHNVIITPEEFPYWAATREELVEKLSRMIQHRTLLDFVRTTVKDEARADLIALHDAGAIPPNFVPVLRHLIDGGAFKLFLDKTSGHFGCKVTGKDYARVSSVRKTNHNRVLQDGAAKIYGYENGRIMAGGARPSVGEHTQDEIYKHFPQIDSIVHFHCPRRPGSDLPSASQWAFECGSVQCGHNTASNMREVEDGIWVVDLDGHGPNIGFRRDVPAERVIGFIDRHFDIADKTGGVLPNHPS